MPNLNKMNLNYLLNRAYYESIEHKNFGDCNKALIERQFHLSEEKVCFSDNSFCLKTIYPGLLIGIGNTHAAGTNAQGIEEAGAEIKLGFTLDYVSGLPIIPGSTVKGVLRSAFKYHSDYVSKLLGIEKDRISDIEKIIFEEGTDKVIFFDAVPVMAGKNNRLFGLENITPHPDELKNPIPLTLLKVIPNVVFLFRFGFKQWEKNQHDNISVKTLLEVFKTILCTLGVGAKTNVGFGVMESVKMPSPFFWLKSMAPVSEEVHSHRSLSRASGTTRKSEGICKWEGCTEKTKQKSPGEFQPYCQKHFLENQNNQRKRG